MYLKDEPNIVEIQGFPRVSQAPMLRYFCDDVRHLVCLPYNVENLHTMAADLGIKQCWFHRGATYPHYDIPKRRIAEIQAKCTVVTQRELLAIVKASKER